MDNGKMRSPVASILRGYYDAEMKGRCDEGVDSAEAELQ